MADAHIVEYYPSSLCPHDRMREMFASYGTCGSINVKPTSVEACIKKKRESLQKSSYMQENFAVEFQCQTTRGCSNTLYAVHPSCPLLPPNPYEDLLSEPCMSNVKKKSKKVKCAVKQLKKARTRMKNRSVQLLVKDMLSQVQSVSAKSEKTIGDHDDIDDDADALDQADEVDRPFILSDSLASLAGQVNILTSASQQLLEGDTQKQMVNPIYAGGCTSFIPVDGNSQEDVLGTLVLPTGPQLSDVSFYPVSCAGNRLSVASAGCKLSLDGRIYETDAVSVNCEHLVVCRCDTETSVMKVERDDDKGAQPALAADVCWPAHDRPTSVCLSPLIAGECAVSTASGSTYLWSADRAMQLCHKSSADNCWHRSHFGSHPRMIITTQHAGVSLIDLRHRDRKAVDLCRVTQPFLHPAEHIMVSRQHPSSSFVHFIATDCSILMMDERYPGYPMLAWTHSLPSPPAYIDVASAVARSSDDVDNLLIVASQDSPPEIHCFQFHSDTRRHAAPQACGPPWRVSVPHDCALLSAYDGCGRGSADMLSHRLQVPIAGLTAIPHRSNTAGGLSIVQVSSFGDVFCQSYEVELSTGTVHRDKTCSAGVASDGVILSDEVLSSVRRWLGDAELQLSAATAARMAAGDDVSFHSVQPLFDEIYSDSAAGNVNCPLCNGTSTRSRSTGLLDAYVDDHVCPQCRHTLSDAVAINEFAHHRKCSTETCTSKMLDVTKTCNVDDSVKNVDFSKCCNTESLLLTKLWNGDSDIRGLLLQRDQELMERFKRKDVNADDAAFDSDTVESEHSNDSESS